MHRPRRLVLVIALAALVAAAVVLAGASGAETRSLTLTELEKGSTFTHIRNTKTRSRQSNSQGDLLVFANPLADASGHVVGKLHAGCATTIGARSFLKSVITCTGVLVLREGTLTIQANSSPGIAKTTGAVTGGTGAYANARGVFVSKEAKGGSLDTITLAD